MSNGLAHMNKWYVGTTNDAAFIIDKPPRPSHDDMADVDGVAVIGCLGTDFEGAKRIVATHNAMLEVIEAARTWVKHECNGDCMAECFWRDATGEALERLDDTLTKDSVK